MNESKCDIRSVLKEGGIYIEGDQAVRIADQYTLTGEAGFGECEVRYEQYDETGRGTRRSSRNGANSWVLAEGDQAVRVIGQNAVDTAIDQPPHFRFVVGVKGMYDEPQAMRFVA